MHRTAISRRRSPAGSLALTALCLTITGCGTGAAVHERVSAPASPRWCEPGARTLSPTGTVLYPEVGNGGYVSIHTATHTVYDARTNRFLPGNHVDLTDRATHCLSSLSLDFEPTAPGHPAGGPDMRVQSVSIDGVPASFRFAQPTYPGDPHGPEDPDPRAHEASQFDPVGGPDHNPLPPACSPQLPREGAVAAPATRLHAQISAYEASLDGTQCPADKLVITPSRPIPDGRRFTITVAYTGTPGLHHDGDGSTEGWQRERDGNWLASEPVGTEDWMPLNDYPTARPTYDFSITTERGRTAIANGIRLGVHANPPDAEFPHGSATTRWRAAMGIPSYLALTIVGDYSIHERTVAGVRYYAFQDRHSSARVRARNARLMAEQPGITRFEAGYSGHYPFASDGIVAGSPATRSAEEEMESMIVLPGNGSGLVSLGGLVHENFHQWWGDDVGDADFNMTFFKEGMATFAVQLDGARSAERTAGGPGSAAGRRAFERYLVGQFDALYALGPGAWQTAPSRRAPATYLDLYAVYERPKAALIALWQILGPHRFDGVLRAIVRRFSDASVSETAVEAAFATGLPDPSPACRGRLRRFFHEWFDTAYRGSKPQITGPGLPGTPFYTHGCAAPRRSHRPSSRRPRS